jgi:hypothetical protein
MFSLPAGRQGCGAYVKFQWLNLGVNARKSELGVSLVKK